ncbi:MAG TPA: hypothetical protein VE888_23280 [Streptosporangiaceae bacterium]|nr:hypothetical protein [Streptosporangiaceae bacterium]
MNIRRWITVGVAAVAAATATTATAATAATTSAQHDYSQQDLQRDLDAITATGVPGVLAEVRTGDRQLRGTSGVADLDSRKPVAAQCFQIHPMFWAYLGSSGPAAHRVGRA